MHAMHAINIKANIVFKDLQGLVTLTSQQRLRLKGLVGTYCSMTQMEGPLEENLDNTDPTVSVNGSFRITHAHVRSCMDGVGRWVLTAMDAMEENTLTKVVASVDDTFVLIADGINMIVPDRDLMNDAAAELPPVFPHQLVVSDKRTLVQCLYGHQDRLNPRFSEQGISTIDEDLAALKKAYRMESQLKAILARHIEEPISFEDAWNVVGPRFEMLRSFCGELAILFPNTSTVECDFSRIGLKKREYRKCLTDVSLENVLHSKQYAELTML